MSGRRRMGRPRVITRDVEERLIHAAATGQFQNAIAVACGIHRVTLARYLALADRALAKRDKGRRLTKFERELCDFSTRFRNAEAGPENVCLGIITRDLEDARKVMEDPKSKPELKRAAVATAYNFAEHRYAARWGRRVNVANETETEGLNAGKKKAFRFTNLADADADQLEEQAAKRGIADLLTVPKPA